MVAFYEEIVYRAYLITRFEDLFQSAGFGVFCSALVFAGAHAYQGAGAVFYTLFFFYWAATLRFLEHGIRLLREVMPIGRMSLSIVAAICAGLSQLVVPREGEAPTDL